MDLDSFLRDYLIGLQHVGHVVDDLEAAIGSFKRVYGIDESAIRRLPNAPDDDTPALFALLSIAGTEFELIEPRSEAMKSMLQGRPSGSAGINHVAWRVTDMDAALEALAGQGIRPGHVTPDGPVSFGDTKILYLDPDDTDGMLIELLQFEDRA